MTVGGTSFLVTLAEVALLLAALVPITSANTYIVGDGMGWNTPTFGAPSPYTTWAGQHTFRVGDSIVFNFNSGSHTVAEVSVDSYNNCNSFNTMNLQTFSPATFTLTSPGTMYYICTIHCSQGMKFSINVVSTGSNNFPPPPGAFFLPPPPGAFFLPPPPGAFFLPPPPGAFFLTPPPGAFFLTPPPGAFFLPPPPGAFFHPPPPPFRSSNAPTNVVSFVISFLSIAFTCFLY